MQEQQAVPFFRSEDEWVQAVNRKCQEIEFMTAFVHPTFYDRLPTLPKLRAEYLAIAHAEVQQGDAITSWNEGQQEEQFLV